MILMCLMEMIQIFQNLMGWVVINYWADWCAMYQRNTRTK